MLGDGFSATLTSNRSKEMLSLIDHLNVPMTFLANTYTLLLLLFGILKRLKSLSR